MSIYKRMSFEERVRIDAYRGQGLSLREIGRKIGRSASSISRELDRFPMTYNAKKAQIQSEFLKRFQRKWQSKLETNENLRLEVIKLLRLRWSPRQISVFLREKYPGNYHMQVSHESIYTYIYVLGRGELKKELLKCLRQKKSARRKRKLDGSNRSRCARIKDMISIEERPKEVENRSLPGHWEGDLLIGKNQASALGTLVERKTRTVILVPLTTASRSPVIVRRAFERAVKTLPKQMRLSMTYDQGFEMREHKLFTANTKMKVYFCHPSSPWERGTCENTNGLIRDYFPKGTDFTKITRREIKRVQNQLNERPRQTLSWQTPKEAFNKEVLKVLR